MTYLSVVFDLLINLVQGFEIRAGKGYDATSGTLRCFGAKNYPCPLLREIKGRKWVFIIFDTFRLPPIS